MTNWITAQWIQVWFWSTWQKPQEKFQNFKTEGINVLKTEAFQVSILHGLLAHSNKSVKIERLQEAEFKKGRSLIGTFACNSAVDEKQSD